MVEAPFITHDEPEHHGPSYVDLRAEAIRLVQQLAGDVWTDYNEHDPGVTILEQLCYALTELTYRAGFSVADLLADHSGVIEWRHHALFPPREAFPCGPLTINDYRRLLADRIKDIGNVWLNPIPREENAKQVQGLYEIELYIPSNGPCASSGKSAHHEIREQVLRTYVAHRNLCEDIHAIHFLAEMPVSLAATLSIDETRVPEAILAELLFNVAQYLAPELRHESLSTLLAQGLAPSKIFEGPWLEDGFIDDDELARRKLGEFPIRDITRILAQTPGVIAARGVSLRIRDGGEISGEQTVHVPEKTILKLETNPDDFGNFSVQLMRRGAPCKIAPERVARELDKLWIHHRRRHPVESHYEHNFVVPCGAGRGDIGEYTSIQHQFPNVYGINAYGPPDHATTLRIAQTRQLKGYLLVFEQLLADAFAQLAHAKDLFSTERDLQQTYFHQSVRNAVPNVAELLAPDYLRLLEDASQNTDPAVDRRSRFLDLLLALHADGLDKQDNNAKISLLERLDEFLRDRGLGFDYLAEPSADKPTPIEARCRIELGLQANAPELFVVEHALLRPREVGSSEQDDFVYSCTITAVVAAPERDAHAFEHAAREVLQRNAPVHIHVNDCFLRRPQMQRFIDHYESFRLALRERAPRAIDETSAQLRRFLHEHHKRRV